jgi:parallel beta-helix repeat protein
MKKSVFAFVFSVLVSGINAQYSTPGTGVIWDMDDLVTNSDGVVVNYEDGYLINADIAVSEYDTIRLTTETMVYFSEATLLTVQGVFQAESSGQIVFTAKDTLANYKGFRFEDSDASYVKNCVIEFGGGIDLLDSDLTIEDCLIWKNDKSNSTGVIDLFHSNPQIINCDIRLNKGPAVLSSATGESSPYILGNTIYRNNTENTNMPQINLGTSNNELPIVIKNNIIEGYYDQVGGIAITTLAGGSLHCMIEGNTIIDNRYGITAYGNDISSEVLNNIIQDNDIQGDPMLGGSGINYFGGNSNISKVSGNTISGNLWGITIQNQAMPNMGQIEPDTVCIGENYFYDNGNGGEVYALYNNTPNDLFAQNNYWGSMNIDSVEAVIFHQPDDPSLGLVNYLPLMDTTTVFVLKNILKKEFIAFPNPVSTIVKIQKPKGFKNKLVQMTVLDETGKLILKKDLISEYETVDVTDFSLGLYFIHITDGEKVFVEKIIKY